MVKDGGDIVSYLRTRSEDWLKTLGWDLPTDFNAFVAKVAPSDATNLQRWFAVRKFTTQPAWEAAPAALKTQVLAYLGKKDDRHPVTLLPLTPLA